MKTQQIELLEGYFKTENEHWNGYALEILCEVLRQGLFENPKIPLQLFSNSIDTLSKYYKHPLRAVQLFTGEIDKHKLNPNQRLFIYERVCKYLDQSEFDFDHTPIKDLLNSQKERLKEDNQPIKPLTKNIRETLKEIVQKELETLPETLKTLEPVHRLNTLCKLLSFILPKVESVHYEQDEPCTFN